MNTAALDAIPGIFKSVVPGRDPKTGEEFVAERLTASNETVWLSHALDFDAMKDQRVQVQDHQGEPVFRKGSDQYEYPVWKVPVIWKEERFVLRAFGNAKVQKIYHFEKTEAERLREERHREVEGYMTVLSEKLVDQGIDPEELIDRLFQDRGAVQEQVMEARASDELDPPDPTAQYSDDEIEAMLEHKGGGNYVLSDESVVKGKAEALAAQRAILAAEIASTPEPGSF